MQDLKEGTPSQQIMRMLKYKSYDQKESFKLFHR